MIRSLPTMPVCLPVEEKEQAPIRPSQLVMSELADQGCCAVRLLCKKDLSEQYHALFSPV